MKEYAQTGSSKGRELPLNDKRSNETETARVKEKEEVESRPVEATDSP